MFRCLKMHTLFPLLVLSPFVLAGLGAQQLDTSTSATQAISQGAERTLKLSFEQRGRYEARTGNAFGNDVDLATGLFRTRLGPDVYPPSNGSSFQEWFRTPVLRGTVRTLQAARATQLTCTKATLNFSHRTRKAWA